MEVICKNHDGWYLLIEDGVIYLDCRVSAGMVDTSRQLELKNEYILDANIKKKSSFDRVSVVPEFAALVTEDMLETAEKISLGIGPIGQNGEPSSVESDAELMRKIKDAISQSNLQQAAAHG
jgi:hypothetical protein